MNLTDLLAVVGAIVGPIATVLALQVNRLRSRDRMQYNRRLVRLVNRLAACETDCKEAKEANATNRELREAAGLQTARLEGELAAANRELRDLRTENEKLRDHLFGTSDASVE